MSGDVKTVDLFAIFSAVNPKVFCFPATTVVKAARSLETVVTLTTVALASKAVCKPVILPIICPCEEMANVFRTACKSA